MTWRNLVRTRQRHRRLALAVWLVAAVPTMWFAAPDVAEASEGERLRLEEEMQRLAERNAWTGVERAYEALMQLKGVEFPVDDHFLGAQAARKIGKTLQVYERLQRALDLDSESEFQSEIVGIDKSYGRVEINGDPRKRPTLVRAAMPFAPDQRKSIEYAQEVVINAGSFRGLLPLGDYTVGYDSFTVEAGPEWQVINVSKKKPKEPKEPKGGDRAPAVATGPDKPAASTPAPSAKPEGFVSDGLIIYAGPIASAGYIYGLSPEPTAGLDAAGQVSSLHPQPAGFHGSGITIDGGGELGFTRHFGVAVTVGYHGVYGNDTFHQVNAWLAAAIRPGNLRIAVGPMYGFLHQNGTGIADWLTYDDATMVDSEFLRLEQYSGMAWGTGAKLTVGYGVLDLEPVQGVVELGAQWMGGPRHYFGFGVRVGIVPLIKRYSG